jgi:quercetin dioxygenase-like cupin family protein
MKARSATRSALAIALLLAMPAFAETAGAGDDAMGRRVQELLHAHQQDVFACVAQQKGKVQGEMLVRVLVGEGGHAAKADVLKDQSNGGPLGSCVVGKMKTWDLSPLGAAAGDQVVFPRVFKPEALTKGERRVLVPMAAQEVAGPQRFVVDDGTIGEAPLATIDRLDLQPNESLPPKDRAADEDELVLFVLAGSFKVGADTVKPYDAVWIGTHTARPAVQPLDKKPVALLEIRAHGKGTGQKVIHSEAAKSYPLAGGKAAVRLLLDGTGAALAVDDLQAEPGTEIPTHKHQGADEELYLLAGRTDTTVGKQHFQTAPGDALRIAANAPHTMKVIGTERLRAVQVYAPAGPEQRFKGGDQPAPKRKPKRKHK